MTPGLPHDRKHRSFRSFTTIAAQAEIRLLLLTAPPTQISTVQPQRFKREHSSVLFVAAVVVAVHHSRRTPARSTMPIEGRSDLCFRSQHGQGVICGCSCCCGPEWHWCSPGQRAHRKPVFRCPRWISVQRQFDACRRAASSRAAWSGARCRSASDQTPAGPTRTNDRSASGERCISWSIQRAALTAPHL